MIKRFLVILSSLSLLGIITPIGATAVSLDSSTRTCLTKAIGKAATQKILKAKRLTASQQNSVDKCRTSGKGSTSTTTPQKSQSTKCSANSIFKRLPVEISKVGYVGPIGVLAPVGGSPLPKQHTGFMLTELGVPLVAPGDLTITQIRKVTYKMSPMRPGYIDYALFFSVCDEVRGHFGHVTNLNETLQPQSSAYQCSTYSTVDETVESCTANTKISVAAGTQLATNGTISESRAIDVGMSDDRLSDGYINPGRYQKTGASGTLCPWDFFTDALKEHLYAKLGESESRLTTETPKCGSVAVDKAGTAAGRWTPKDSPGNGADAVDGRFLVFAPDVYSPRSRIAFSTRINGITPTATSDGFTYPRFPLQESGRVNLVPASVTADGQVYCYVVNASSSTESFFVQMTTAAELKVERLTHATAASPCNQSPSTWNFSSGAVSLIR